MDFSEKYLNQSLDILKNIQIKGRVGSLGGRCELDADANAIHLAPHWTHGEPWLWWFSLDTYAILFGHGEPFGGDDGEPCGGDDGEPCGGDCDGSHLTHGEEDGDDKKP